MLKTALIVDDSRLARLTLKRLLAKYDIEVAEAEGVVDGENWISRHTLPDIVFMDIMMPDLDGYDYCVWKGVDPALHPYGACYHDIEERLSTGLIEWLAAKQARFVLVGGLATDYCVKHTVLQLCRGGNWQVIVNCAACRGIAPETVAKAWQEMEAAGALLLSDTAEIEKYFKSNV